MKLHYLRTIYKEDMTQEAVIKMSKRPKKFIVQYFNIVEFSEDIVTISPMITKQEEFLREEDIKISF